MVLPAMKGLEGVRVFRQVWGGGWKGWCHCQGATRLREEMCCVLCPLAVLWRRLGSCCLMPRCEPLRCVSSQVAASM